MRKGKPLIVAIVAVLGGALFWALQDGPLGDPTDPISNSSGDKQAAEELGAEPISAVTAKQVASQTEEGTLVIAADPAREEVAQNLATFRGRCVDADGEPLAGVRVGLRGSPHRSRIKAYTREHGEVEYDDPQPVETDAGGRFELAFNPPAPYRFWLSFRHEDVVPVEGFWVQVDQGAVIDLGEITLPRGVRVKGRLVDSLGVAVPSPKQGARIELRLPSDDPRRHARIVVDGFVSTAMMKDGSFEFDERLPRGDWEVRFSTLELLTKRVKLEKTGEVLDIIVERPGELLTLRGIVVDEAGQPVARARISTQGRHGGDQSTSSKRDGSFLLDMHSKGDPGGEFTLTARARDCEYLLQSEESYKWGDEKVKLVMRRGLNLELLVVRDDDGTAVEAYTARVIPLGGRYSSSMDREPRDGSEHEGGILLVKGLRRGRIGIFIEPAVSTGVGPTQRFLVHEGDRPASLVIRLSATVEQVIRMRTADGKPVVGSKVELIDAMGEEVAANTYVRDFGPGGFSSAEVGLILSSSKSDANGEVRFRVATGRPHVLRCLGEHPAVVKQDVVLSGQPLEIIVPVGATVRVLASPVSVLSYWREAGGLPSTGDVGASGKRSLPRIYLIRTVNGVSESFPTAKTAAFGVPFDEKGHAELRGAPVGLWDLMLDRTMRNGSSSSRQTVKIREGLTLRDGMAEEIEWDLTPHIPGGFHASVMIDGKPASGRLQLWRELDELLPDGRRRRVQLYLRVDEQGVVDTKLPPGHWQGKMTIEVADQKWVDLPLHPAFDVMSGQKTQVTLRASIGSLRVRILGPDGEPVEGVMLATNYDQPGAIQLQASDAAGEAKIMGPPGSYKLRVRIRSMTLDTALRQWKNKKRAEFENDWKRVNEAMEKLYVKLPEIRLEAGAGDEALVIQLPKDWDR